MSYVFPSVNTSSVSTREPVVVATTAPGTLATDFENGDTIDGVVLTTGDRILIKDQASAVENGIYEVQATGAPVRASDFYDGSSAAGITITVTEGVVNNDTMWLCTTDPPNDIIGTNTLNFVCSAGLGANGDIVGPVSSTTNTVPRFADTSGKTLTTTGLVIDGSDNLSGVASLVLEAGTNDVTLSATAQTVGASTINIPDLGGVSGDMVVSNAVQTLSNKTLTGPVFTNPQINDTSSDHQYIFAVNELTANRTITLPLLTTSDTFTFENHTQTLTNKTLTLPVISQISNGGGTLTLPSGATDTLVARATADTLTNKTMTASNNTFSGFQHGVEVDEPASGVHGVTGTIVGTSDTQTLTNKTITSPIINQITTDGTEQVLIFADAGTAVNEFTITNAATGTDPMLSATGDDASIGIALETKGAGTVSIGSASATDSGILELFDDTGGQSASITVPSAIGASYTLTLPDGVGTSGQVLTTDGNNPAVLTWATAAAGVTINEAFSTDNYQSTSDTYVVITSMTLTPGAGTYFVSFSANNAVDNKTTTYQVAIFSNGVIVAHTERDRSHSSANNFTSTQTQCETTIGAGQSIDVRVRRTAGTGSVIFENRSLVLIS